MTMSLVDENSGRIGARQALSTMSLTTATLLECGLWIAVVWY